MDVLRTPDERFAALPGWDFQPCYVELDGLRMHYVDEGPPDAPPVLLLHGEPTWAYVYRTVIAHLAAAGHRVIAADLIGFGRSDKPRDIAAHTYERHVAWVASLVEALDLRDITLVCQDWGGLIGLRVATENDERFAAVVAANTGLPTGDHPMPEAWWQFRNWIETAETLPISFLVNSGCTKPLTAEVMHAYDAPFPSEEHKAGPRALPLLIPTSPEDPAAPANRRAWERLMTWDRPFLCAFSDRDPITRDAGPLFAKLVPGAAGQSHPTLTGAGHFLQEDAGEELAGVIADFLAGV
jgi:haloalkane dehalogenase